MDFQTISGERGRYVVSQAGDGPDVVLLHGFPDTPHSYAALQSTLAGSGRRATTAWLRGYHPETIVPGRRYDPETIGRDGLGLLDALGLQRAVLVGHDWGALIAYVAAALEPERVAGIVALAIPHPSLVQRTPASLWAVRHFFALKLPWAASSCRRGDFAYLEALYRRWAPGWSGPEREECLRQAKLALSPPQTLDGAISYYRDLPLVRGAPVLEALPAVPGLIVGGTRDLIAPELITRTAELLGAPSRSLLAEGAGHWPHLERAHEVEPALLAFLQEIGS